MHYNLIERIKSLENPTVADKRLLDITMDRCKPRCEKTAYDFYEWLKSSGRI